MATYMESEMPTIVSSGNNGNGFLNGEGLWAIIIFAMIFGWGNGGFGFGNGGRGASENIGYELGKMATTNDVAAGFNNSAVISKLNDLALGQAGLQQTACQGFSGINMSIANASHSTDREIANLGFALTSQISNCCCDIRSTLLENRYLNERQTCDLINNNNANTQRILDYLCNEKISSLQSENAALTAQLSQNAQTTAIVNALSPKQPIPAYPVFPATSFAFPTGVSFGVNGNCGCGCNGTTNIQ